MTDEFHQYQTTSQLTASIAKLEAISKSNASFEDMVAAARLLVPGHHHEAFLLPERTWLYRARIFRGNDKPASPQDLSYAPSQYIKEYHRVGPIGEASFYSSDDMTTALREVYPVVGDVVAVSEWTTSKELTLIMAGFSQALVEEWSENSATYGSFANEARWLSGIPVEHVAGNLKVREYFARRFTESANADSLDAHKVSASIARALGYSSKSKIEFDKTRSISGNSDGPPFDGILYPSIVQRGKHVNIALRPYSVDKYLQFKSVSLYSITEMEDNKIITSEFDFTRTLDDNGKFVWKGSPGVYATRWPGDQIKLECTGVDQYKVTDMDGRQIERS